MKAAGECQENKNCSVPRGKIKKSPNLFSGPKLLDVIDNYNYMGVKFNFISRVVQEKNNSYILMDVEHVLLTTYGNNVSSWISCSGMSIHPAASDPRIRDPSM